MPDNAALIDTWLPVEAVSGNMKKVLRPIFSYLVEDAAVAECLIQAKYFLKTVTDWLDSEK